MASVAKPVSKSTKPKKSSASSDKTRSHPPYVEMIKEAIVALKERTGSSQYAISKFIEEKQGNKLPSNFKKLLLNQLKKIVASGKLIKVKNSFKLAAESKSVSVKKTKSVATVKSKADKAAVAKGKKVATKPKAAAATKPKKSAKTATITSPGKAKKAVTAVKKTAKKAAAVKPKKVVAKVVKKPKSIKTPVKKAPVKKTVKKAPVKK